LVLFIWSIQPVWFIWLVLFHQTNETDRIDLADRVLVRRAEWLWAEPGGVLKDALWAGVVDKLLAADQAFLHRHPAPCAEAIGEIG